MKFYYFESSRIGEKINKKYLKLNYDYIFCFRSFYILKNNILKKVNYASINFHPGPPEYRGTGCVYYALYKNSKFSSLLRTCLSSSGKFSCLFIALSVASGNLHGCAVDKTTQSLKDNFFATPTPTAV